MALHRSPIAVMTNHTMTTCTFPMIGLHNGHMPTNKRVTNFYSSLYAVMYYVCNIGHSSPLHFIQTNIKHNKHEPNVSPPANYFWLPVIVKRVRRKSCGFSVYLWYVLYDSYNIWQVDMCLSKVIKIE